MTNNQEFLDGILDEEIGWDIELDLPVVRCPFCKSLVQIDETVDGQYCPICFEDLSEEFEEVLKENED